jgi:hypothetical protein
LCNLYSITTNQAAIIALFRVINRYEGNLAPLPGVLPPPPRTGGPPVTNIRNTSSPYWRGWLKPREPMSGAVQQLRRICAGAKSSDQEEGCGLVWTPAG